MSDAAGGRTPDPGWDEARRRFQAPDGDAAAEPPADDPDPSCTNCGAALDPDQTYCLTCGEPAPRAPRLRRAAGAGALLAGALAVLGIGAAALALAVASGDDTSAIATAGTAGPDTGVVIATDTTDTGGLSTGTVGPLPTDTSVTPTLPPDTGFDTVTTPPQTATTPSTPIDPDPVPGDDSDWPAGRTGYTAILSSVRNEQDARASARRASSSGTQAGVLFSSDHPNLNPGYWVVFSGVFSDAASARARAASLRGAFPGAYARRVDG